MPSCSNPRRAFQCAALIALAVLAGISRLAGVQEQAAEAAAPSGAPAAINSPEAASYFSSNSSELSEATSPLRQTPAMLTMAWAATEEYELNLSPESFVEGTHEDTHRPDARASSLAFLRAPDATLPVLTAVLPGPRDHFYPYAVGPPASATTLHHPARPALSCLALPPSEVPPASRVAASPLFPSVRAHKVRALRLSQYLAGPDFDPSFALRGEPVSRPSPPVSDAAAAFRPRFALAALRAPRALSALAVAAAYLPVPRRQIAHPLFA